MKKLEVQEEHTSNPHALGKLFFSLLVMFLFCHVASSQVKVGVMVCPQFNQSFGVRVGTDIDIPFSSRWSFVPGAYWSLRNRKSEQSGSFSTSDGEGWEMTSTYRDRAHFLTVPLRMGVRLAGRPDGNFRLKLLFGPYVAYGMGGTSKYDLVKDGVEKHAEAGAFGANGRYRSRWDYGIKTELHMVLRQHFLIGIFEEVGFRKIYKSDSVVDDILGEIFLVNKINVGIGLTLGYQF